MIKIKNINMITPLGSIELQNKPVENLTISTEEFQEVMNEFGDAVSGKLAYFVVPTQDNKVYVIGKEILITSIVQAEIEECQEKSQP